MKTYSKHIKGLLGAIACMGLLSFISCTENPASVKEASGPPQLDRVSLVNKDSTTTTGLRNNEYVIYGKNLAATQAVTFNGANAYFNPTLATNTNLIIKVPDDAPYKNSSDSLVVTNSKGSASLLFHILQPPPAIDGFTPAAASAGDIVTIMGTVFDDADSVYFGDTPAEIVSSTPTQIKVRVPEGIVQANITVVTPGGRTTSEDVFGFRLLVYADSFTLIDDYGWYAQAYNATYDYSNTEHVNSGTNSIRVTLTSGYGALQAGAGDAGTPVDVSSYTALKFSIYVDDAIGSLNVVLNSTYDPSVNQVITPTPGQYETFTIPLSVFGSPAQFTEIVIQGQGGVGTFYVDDIGFI